MTNDPSVKLLKKYDFYILQFIEKHQLFTKNDQLLVLVSGGADSLALLSFLLRCKFNVQALYFHHGTRSKSLNQNHESLNLDEHQIEIDKIKKVFNQNQYSHDFFSIEYIHDLKLTDRNFEEKARTLRRHLVQKKYSQFKFILTGHHLNDSFEWWLRGRLTQNQAHLPLGIPLVHDKWIKPFLCLTKKQILSYAKLLSLDFHEDSSNDKLKFERNFLRKKIIQSIEIKYPRYLKHYVAQANQLAYKLNIHRLSQKKKITNNSKFKKIFENTYLLNLDKEFPIEELMKLLIPFSQSKRGKWSKCLQQVFPNGMINPDLTLGPISLSGSLHFWINHKTLYLYLSPKRPDLGLRELDEFLTNNFSHIPLRSEIITILSKMKITVSPKRKLHSDRKITGIKRILPRFAQLIEKIDHQIFAN